MKSNKITQRLLALLTALVLPISLASCDAVSSLLGDVDWDAHQRTKKAFYGVGAHISELDNACIFISELGHVTMPSTEDGSRPDFKSGDLIEIVFDTTDDLALMESFPARFGISASSIKVKPANIELQDGDGSSFITVDIPDTLTDVEKEDTLVYKMALDEQGEQVEKDFCEAVVKNVSDGRMTLLVTVELSELLEELFYDRLTLEYSE